MGGSRSPRRLVLLALAAAAIAWLWLNRDDGRDPAGRWNGSSVGQQAVVSGMAFATYAWIFALGASVGSFVNVIAARSGAADDSLWRRSACPRCRTPLTFAENLPALGWLRLRGRSRCCGQPIAVRYLLMELAFGAAFVLFALAELHTGGRWVAGFPPYLHAGVTWIIWYTKWDLVGIWMLHMAALSTLAAWTLMAAAGATPRWRTSLVALALAGAFAAAFPNLLPLKFGAAEWSPAALALASWALGALAGAAAGAGLAAFRPAERTTVVMGSALLGACLGWQTILWLAAVVACLLVAVWFLRRSWVRPTMAMLNVTLFALPFWRLLPGLPR